jgi:2-dehydro-3-deoxyphosphooctonate aldolase (KDO 8-P synthase)
MSLINATQRGFDPAMTVIAGPCVIEDEGMLLEVAKELKSQLSGLPVRLYFKSSFDKANRTSIHGFRGPGLEDGLRMLGKVKAQTGLPLLTDFHSAEQAEPVAQVVDFLQVPAFLCRQTDMIMAAAHAALTHGRRVNVKKGQFLAPWDTRNIVTKAREVQGVLAKTPGFKAPPPDWLTLCERGASFGYNTLVVDMTGIPVMQSYGVPVIHDATHSVQRPGGGSGGASTGGRREFIETLSRSAMAAGADGIFLECHPNPSKAKSDGPNAMPLELVGPFIRQMLAIRQAVSDLPKLLPFPENFSG